MSVSTPFIRRPIATSLLGVAIMLGGLLGYWSLPVSSLPQVDFPTIQVTTRLPGANPDTMTALVTAPIDGRTGLRLVDEGNIVRAGDPTGIVVITQIKPISVLFNLPQQQLNQVNKALARGPLQVETLGLDNKVVLDRGTLQVVDNQVDPTTGTVRLKAEFPNPELQLWPGQFVNVRLLIETLPQVVVVPTAAVQRGPTGPFVYVAQPDNTAVVRVVSVTQQDETQAVIASGVQPGERVVTSGFARLSGNARISVTAAEDPQSPATRPAGPATPEVRRRPEGGGRPESSGRGEGRRGQRSEAAPNAPP